MSQIDDLIRSFATASGGDEVERKATEAARRVLRATIAAETAPTHNFPGANRFRWLALAGALAILIATAAALLPSGAGDEAGRLGAAPASAQIMLERAARALTHQDWHPLRPGEWDYFRYLQNYPQNGPASNQPTEVDEAWIAGDGSGRLLQRGLSPANHGSDVIPFGPRKWVRIGTARMLVREPWHWAGLDYQQLLHLPTDPAALQREIEQRARTYGQQPHDAETFTFVADLMREAPAPPNLRASLFRVIARLPGVQLVGPTHDPLGRAGVAVGFPSGAARSDLIFNPNTGALLAERTVSLSSKSGAPSGDVIGWDAIQIEAIVHSNHTRPHGAVQKQLESRFGSVS